MCSFVAFHSLLCNLSRSKLIFKVPTKGSTILTNLIINALLDANADRKLTNFTDSEPIKTPKTVCYKKTKKSISLDSRFVDLESTGLCATLNQFSSDYCVPIK